VAARSVKWLHRIVASPNESPSHWQQNDYKTFHPSVDWDTVDFRSSPAIQDVPVQSAICEPAPGTVVPPDLDELTVKGYAWSGGGRPIIRVDVSADGGTTWHNAQLAPANSSDNKAWAWTRWQATVPIPSSSDKLRLICKGVDSSFNVQPENVEGIWNLRGVLGNSWFRVDLPRSPPAPPPPPQSSPTPPRSS